MQTLKFKTSLKCDGCIKSVTPYMNEIKGIISWKADLKHPEAILEVIAEDVDENLIIKAVNKAGHRIERITQ
jgi:copper chaperone